jgi:hypothetical protein
MFRKAPCHWRICSTNYKPNRYGIFLENPPPPLEAVHNCRSYRREAERHLPPSGRQHATPHRLSLAGGRNDSNVRAVPTATDDRLT